MTNSHIKHGSGGTVFVGADSTALFRALTAFKWNCLNCQCEQIETIDPIDGPFLTCTCKKCGKAFDQDALPVVEG